jgi:hypothetical protein
MCRNLIIFILNCILFTHHSVFAQSADEVIFMQKMKIQKADNEANTLIKMGKSFMEEPYVAATLEGNAKENLVCNLRQFDCWTFVENTLALTLTKYANHPTFSHYTEKLQQLRYREGKINGYGSRLHYFLEWMYQAEKNALLKNITKEIGGERIDKSIHFMTQHRKSYAGLKDESAYQKVQDAENRLNLRNFVHIPKHKVAAIENKLQDGDIIAITSNIDGLDVNHEGFAIRINGRIHLLHASQEAKKVIISEEPLSEYLNRIKKHSGIMVLRIR